MSIFSIEHLIKSIGWCWGYSPTTWILNQADPHLVRLLLYVVELSGERLGGFFQFPLRLKTQADPYIPAECCYSALWGRLLYPIALTPSITHSVNPSLSHSINPSLHQLLTKSLTHSVNPSLSSQWMINPSHSETIIQPTPHSVNPSPRKALTQSFPTLLMPRPLSQWSIPHSINPSLRQWSIPYPYLRLNQSFTQLIPHSTLSHSPLSQFLITQSIPHSVNDQSQSLRPHLINRSLVTQLLSNP